MSAPNTPQPDFHERPFIRRQIIRILVVNVYGGPTAMRDPKLRETIKRQSLGYENVLYKRSICMEDYGDLATLEQRVMKLVEVMIARNHERRRTEQS